MTSPEPSDRLHRPAIDVLFESLAEACLGRESLGVLLTGMGEDGARGLAAVRRSGGWTIVQDEATSVVWGMAAAARRVGAACETLPIHRIGKRLLSLTDSESKRSC